MTSNPERISRPATNSPTLPIPRTATVLNACFTAELLRGAGYARVGDRTCRRFLAWWLPSTGSTLPMLLIFIHVLRREPGRRSADPGYCVPLVRYPVPEEGKARAR